MRIHTEFLNLGEAQDSPRVYVSAPMFETRTKRKQLSDNHSIIIESFKEQSKDAVITSVKWQEDHTLMSHHKNINHYIQNEKHEKVSS